MPIIAVIDPEMMSSMPKGLTASTGMDALTHAIEGYTTKAAWEMTDMFHLEAIKLISASLRDAVENKKEGREGMALGQYIAGMGFSNVGLGIAHSMAHTLGAVYDTPHGVACAMMLPIVMEYNQDCTGEKYREIAREIWQAILVSFADIYLLCNNICFYIILRNSGFVLTRLYTDFTLHCRGLYIASLYCRCFGDAGGAGRKFQAPEKMCCIPNKERI